MIFVVYFNGLMGAGTKLQIQNSC